MPGHQGMLHPDTTKSRQIHPATHQAHYNVTWHGIQEVFYNNPCADMQTSTVILTRTHGDVTHKHLSQSIWRALDLSVLCNASSGCVKADTPCCNTSRTSVLVLLVNW